jgi:chorismate synthase
MRYVTAGESHGQGLVAVVEGVPAGLGLSQSALDADLARRQVGYGRGGRMAIERDQVRVLAGVRHGKTLGTPIALAVDNLDWENWSEEMAPFGEGSGAPITAPRPGHADLAGVQKTGTTDVRNVLERASARETAARVAAGGVAKALLAEFGVAVRSAVTRIGSVEADLDPDTIDIAAVEASDVRCPDEAVAQRMRDVIDDARADGESLGGTFVVWADGLIPGLGGYASAGDRLDGRLAQAVVSIPAIKGVEFGDGFALAARKGSEAHDEILPGERHPERRTNRAGGLEGGMTNGQKVVVSAAMKPIPTLMRPLASIDLATSEPVDASKERSDVCAVPAAAVVAEAEVAMVLADAYTSKFGGDALGDMLAAERAYRDRIGW